jgi:hypothetical protein
VRRLLICLCMILPVHGMTAEIPLNEHTQYWTLFDGVYMDEATYKDYVIKSVNYDKLVVSHKDLLMDFEEYKEESEAGCGPLTTHGGWFIVGLLVTGFGLGYASGR